MNARSHRSDRSDSRRSVRAAACAFALLLAGCAGTTDLLYAPKHDDPLDGYAGSLAEAGVNTEMDWGPKQDLLLGEFKALKEEHVRLRQRLDQVLAENQNLKTRLADESEALTREKSVRAQVEAESEGLKQRRRELEARILGLSIEKSKLEQQALQARIADVQKQLEELQPAEAAAPPPGRSR